jgi:hypothetical protein
MRLDIGIFLCNQGDQFAFPGAELARSWRMARMDRRERDLRELARYHAT